MSLEPYYQDDAVTIYHVDCRALLPCLPKIAVVISDPPYGIAHRRGVCSSRGKGVTLGAGGIEGDIYPFNPALLLGFPEQILWGANYYADKLPPRGRWLIWDKQEHGGSGDFSEAEIAWHSEGRAVKVFRHMWLGVQRMSEVGEKRLHPTQKPVALFSWCIQQAKSQGVILDPFMGSGSAIRAAKDLGRKAIGIEIEEKYCEIAAGRMLQEVLALA